MISAESPQRYLRCLLFVELKLELANSWRCNSPLSVLCLGFSECAIYPWEKAIEDIHSVISSLMLWTSLRLCSKKVYDTENMTMLGDNRWEGLYEKGISMEKGYNFIAEHMLCIQVVSRSILAFPVKKRVGVGSELIAASVVCGWAEKC